MLQHRVVRNTLVWEQVRNEDLPSWLDRRRLSRRYRSIREAGCKAESLLLSRQGISERGLELVESSFGVYPD
jgi:hypothetical protein